MFEVASRDQVWRFLGYKRRLEALCLSFDLKFCDFLEVALGEEIVVVLGEETLLVLGEEILGEEV